jgi:hypothetical protein
MNTKQQVTSIRTFMPPGKTTTQQVSADVHLPETKQPQ